MMAILGPFEIQSYVDGGGMGHVWRAHHVETKTPVAIKVVPLREGADGAYVFRFRTEIRAIASIMHPGVIGIVDEGVVDADSALAYELGVPCGSPFVVMEWASEGHLGQRVLTMDWCQVRAILLSLLDALAAAHARGIVHRDIKPKNILFSDGRLRLADFGGAFHADFEQLDPTLDKMIGSPNFMAPEQILCNWRELGPWTDLYAVGCLAWLLTTRSAPFARQSGQEVLRAHLSDPLPLHEPTFLVPPRFDEWCAKLLAKRHQDRFAFAADAACQLVALGDPILKYTPVKFRPLTVGVAPENTILSPPFLLPVEKDEWKFEPFELDAPPPTPKDWRRPMSMPRENPISGTGLAVFSKATAGFVGREAERDQLWRALWLAQNGGGGQAFFVEGPAGSGKTSMGRWLAERGHEIGACHALKIRHQAGEDRLVGIRQMLQTFFRTGGLEGRNRYDHLRKALSRWRSEILTVELDALLDAGQRSAINTNPFLLLSHGERLYTLTSLLRMLTKTRPLVVVVDDAQWGQVALEWMFDVLTHHPYLPVIWVASWRDVSNEVEATTVGVYEALRAMDCVHRFTLDPLNDDDTRTLIQSRIRLEDKTLRRLLSRVQGNPLFAEQLVEHWIQSGSLQRAETGFRVRSRQAQSIPDSVYGVWQERIANLGLDRVDDRQFALEMAASLGQRFDLNDWREACRRGDIQHESSFLVTLEEHDLIAYEGQGSFAFVHSLLCESLQRQFREAGRAPFMNLVCAETLERSDNVSWKRVGQHYFEAHCFVAAANAYRKASHERLKIGDPVGHLDMTYRTSLSLRKAKVPLRDRRWSEVRYQWARTKSMTGDQEQALRHFRAARVDLCPDADAILYVGALVGEGQLLHEMGYPSLAVLCLREAVRRSEKTRDLPLRVNSHVVYSRFLRREGKVAASLRQYCKLQAIVTEERLGELSPEDATRVRAKFMIQRFIHCRFSGRLGEALEYAAECEPVVRNTGNRYMIGWFYMDQGDVQRDAGLFDEAACSFESAMNALEAIRSKARFLAMSLLAVCRAQQGRYEEALDLQRQADQGLVHRGFHVRDNAELPLLGALARLARWQDWDDTFYTLRQRIEQRQLPAYRAVEIELSVDHVVAVGEFGRAELLIEALITSYRNNLRSGDVRRMESRLIEVRKKTASVNLSRVNLEGQSIY